MNIHEYQAKALLQKYGIKTPRNVLVQSHEAIPTALQTLSHAQKWVIKAQIHAGGRGKVGGVQIASSPQEAQQMAKNLIGSFLITEQNHPNGQIVSSVLVEEARNIQRELYLSLTIDRNNKSISIITSPNGGMDIEMLVQEKPECIFKISCQHYCADFQARQLAFQLRLNADEMKQFISLVKNLHRLFIETDLNLIEINPLIIDNTGELIALDCKISIDDNALYRQKALSEMLDETQEDPREIFAKKTGFNYIALDGDIACIVNGAGLAMATMDIIKYCGGNPANFLDVGGGANIETISLAFQIILNDKNVKAILINIFGGIMRCDFIAEGVISAVNKMGLTIPLVVRLEGTNKELGKKILQKSGLKIISENNLMIAAQQVTALAKGA